MLNRALYPKDPIFTASLWRRMLPSQCYCLRGGDWGFGEVVNRPQVTVRQNSGSREMSTFWSQDLWICYIAWQEEMEVACGFKLLISWHWEREAILEYLSRPKIIRTVLKSEIERQRTVSEWSNERRTCLAIAGFEDRRGHKPRNAGSLWKVGKARRCILPCSLWKEHSLLTPWF